MNLELILGLEIHLQPKLNSKMFCRCSAEFFGKKPNSHTCPTCLGLPGSLPVPNKKAIEQTHLLGLALNCTINMYSRFDRKHYFYPDLPKGYQISQFDLPLCENGFLWIHNRKIRISRVHLEEDTGKSIHEGNKTLLDYNKSGVALIEIVTEPDFRTKEDAVDFSKEVQRIARYLGLSDADMEKGQLRLEANISMREEAAKAYPPYKVEVKNINSFRFFEKAVTFETERQSEIIRSGKQPLQENRGWDDVKSVTRSQRSKEESHDYRYFPEPDIPPMQFKDVYIQNLKKKLVELPQQKHKRFIGEYGLSDRYAYILTETALLADLFERMSRKVDVRKVANLLVNKPETRSKGDEELERLLNQLPVDCITEEKMQKIVDEVLAENRKSVEDYRLGKKEAVMYLVGRAMRKAEGKVDALTIRKKLEESL